MAEKEVEIDIIASFHSDEYGYVDAHERKTVRVDVAERWIAEGKALPVLEAAAIETADLKHKK